MIPSTRHCKQTEDWKSAKAPNNLLLRFKFSTYPFSNSRVPSDDSRLKESVILDPRVLEEDTSLKPRTLSNDTVGSNNDIGSDGSGRVDSRRRVNHNVSGYDSRVLGRVGKFRRFLRGEVGEVEASSGEVICTFQSESALCRIAEV